MIGVRPPKVVRVVSTMGRVRLSPAGNGFIARQQGMFSFSGLDRDQVGRLRDEHSVYLVASGRLNVAGMTPDNMPVLCDAIAAVIGESA